MCLELESPGQHDVPALIEDLGVVGGREVGPAVPSPVLVQHHVVLAGHQPVTVAVLHWRGKQRFCRLRCMCVPYLPLLAGLNNLFGVLCVSPVSYRTYC